MQEQIQIIASYPDLGTCCLHMKQNTRVCLSCQKTRKYYCGSCLNHEAHKTQSGEQYVRHLSKKLASIKPAHQGKQALSKTFFKLCKDLEEFENSIKIMLDVLKSINQKKIILYNMGLSLNADQIFDKLCEMQIRQNGHTIQEVIQDLKLQFDNPVAPKLYEQWAKSLSSWMNKFNNKVIDLREQSFGIDHIFNTQVVASKVRKQKISSPIKANSVFDKKKVDLFNKDYSAEQVILTIKDQGAIQILQLNLENNRVDNQGLQQLLTELSTQLVNLQKLNLRNNSLQSDCLGVILKANLPKLTMLNLEGNFIFLDEVKQTHKSIMLKWPRLQINF